MFLQNFYNWKPVRAIAAILLVSITVISCTSSGSTSEPIAPNQETLENPYEWVGRMHNQGLVHNAKKFSAPEVNNSVVNILRNNATNIRQNVVIVF